MPVANEFPKNLVLVIFDVDGTLYDQNKLRKKMIGALLRYYIVRLWRYKDLVILHQFRKERESRAGQRFSNLQSEQYSWCATKTKLPLSRVKEVVDKWMFSFPNRYLYSCRYPGVAEFFDALRKANISIAIYSDYDSTLKLKSMGLKAEMVVSSTDKEVNALKPLPDGLNRIIFAFPINDKNSCLFIGDRVELDAECARLAEIPFLLVNKKKAKSNLYNSLSTLLKKR